MAISAKPIRLTPEARMVFLTAGGAATDGEVASLARSGINWQHVVAIAEREHAVSTLWRALDRSAKDVVPAVVADHLRKSGMVTDFRMMHLDNRLRTTLAALRDRGVQPMLIKGAALGAHVYRAFNERPMGDIDMLVRAEDIPNARLAILDSGWGEHQLPVVSELLADHHHLVPYYDKASTGLRLELHTSMLPRHNPFALDEREIWNSARPARAEYSEVLIPMPRHLVFHACLHFAYSHTMEFGAWRTFRDLTELADRSGIDWKETVEFARRTRAATSCYWTMRLARGMCRCPIPDDVVAQLSPPTPEFAQRVLERHLVSKLAPWEGPTCPSVSLDHLLWRAAIRPKWSGHRTPPDAPAAKNWDAALHGTKPDAAPSRVWRHLTSIGTWWKYMVRTLMPLS